MKTTPSRLAPENRPLRPSIHARKMCKSSTFLFLSFFLSSLQKGERKTFPQMFWLPIYYSKKKKVKKETRKILIVNKQNILPCPGTLASLTPWGNWAESYTSCPSSHRQSRTFAPVRDSDESTMIHPESIDDSSPFRVHGPVRGSGLSVRLCASNSTFAKVYFSRKYKHRLLIRNR